MKKILHIVPGLNDPTCGIAVAAQCIAEQQRKGGDHVSAIGSGLYVDYAASVAQADEVWVHSMWTPGVLRGALAVLWAHKRLVRMPHGCLDPVKMRYHWWKKMFFVPLERWLMRRAERIVATEKDETEWIESFVRPVRRSTPKIEMLDLGRAVGYVPRPGLGSRKFLFVGRMHPLKGVDVLIAAVRQLKDEGMLPVDFQLTIIGKDEKGMREEFESAAQGLPITFLGEVEEDFKRREMAASDCLILPTLSENFGLVVKESLECGVPAITTDGAKYWKDKPGVTYIEGYLTASHLRRVQMLKVSLKDLLGV